MLKVGAVVAAAALGVTAVATVVVEGGGSGEGASRPSLAQLSNVVSGHGGVIASGAASTEAATRGHATQLRPAAATADSASPSDAISNAIKTAGTALTADQRAMFEGEAAQAVHMEKM